MAQLYGVLDTARDERLYDLVRNEAETTCLFSGEIDPVLKPVLPYLVRFERESQLRATWEQAGRGQSWGILLRADGSLAEMRRHLRRFLQVRLPDGEVVQFRFYDPRVWRPYIASCVEEELRAWFDRVDEYWAEIEGGGGWHRYRLEDDRLVTR